MTPLTLLIPTMPRRSHFLDSLVQELQRQCALETEPPLIIVDDGEYTTIGAKRNAMVSQVETQYMAFIDDDDELSPNYIRLVLTALESKPDCCSLNGIITTDGENPKVFKHSIKYTTMYEAEGIYYRPPNHINTIKTEIVRSYPFPDWDRSEDSNFCLRMAIDGVLKTEAEIQETIYYYRYRSDKRQLG